MIEEASRRPEALVLKDNLYGALSAPNTVSIGETAEAIAAQRDGDILRLLELRKAGELPFPTAVILITNPLVELTHPYSTTPFLLEIPKKPGRTGPISVRSSLRRLRKDGVVEDSLQALELLGPHTITDRGGSKLLTRTVEEIQEIDAIRDLIPQGTQIERRRSLRELRDGLIIDRFIFAVANNSVTRYSSIRVDRRGDIIFVAYSYHRRRPQQFMIEAPNQDKYSAERNERLSVLLAKLGLV